MSPKTAKILAEMIAYSNTSGREIYPFMFQPGPYGGTNASVGAAVRAGLKSGQLVKTGIDGVGKPKYRAAEIKATHAATGTVN